MNISLRVRGIVMLVLIACSLCIVFICSKNGADLRHNGIFTVGYVTRVYAGTRGGINIDYYFYANGNKITGSGFYFISSAFVEKFENKSFPVIYSKTNKDRNRLLVTKGDFEEFNMGYPDSLKWVLDLKSL